MMILAEEYQRLQKEFDDFKRHAKRLLDAYKLENDLLIKENGELKRAGDIHQADVDFEDKS